MLFKIGDVIVYGVQGVCKIDCIQTKQIGKQVMEYYVLKPIFNNSTSVFVPVENETLTAKMKDVLTCQQATNFINSIPHINPDVNSINREDYKTFLASGDREKLALLVKVINKEKELRREVGKKLNLNDEQTLRKAEQLLYHEIAYIFDVTPAEAQNMIKI